MVRRLSRYLCVYVTKERKTNMRLKVELTDKGKELINEAIKEAVMSDGAVTVKKVVDEEVESKGTIDAARARVTNIGDNNISQSFKRDGITPYINRRIEEVNRKIDNDIMSLANRITILESQIEGQN